MRPPQGSSPPRRTNSTPARLESRLFAVEVIDDEVDEVANSVGGGARDPAVAADDEEAAAERECARAQLGAGVSPRMPR